MGRRSWMVLCGLEIAYEILVRRQMFDGSNSRILVLKVTRIGETIV
jgi:hypothetical protein